MHTYKYTMLVALAKDFINGLQQEPETIDLEVTE